jgi:hypothetical protein
MGEPVLLSWRARVVKREQDVAKFYDRVMRVRLDPLETEQTNVTVLGEFARDVWNPVDGQVVDCLMKREHNKETLDHNGMCARGIVARKDDEFVMVSCGGLMWLFASAHLAGVLEIEDCITIIIA